MADQQYTGGIIVNGQALPEKARDMGDGTFARVGSSVAVNPDGSPQSSALTPVATNAAAGSQIAKASAGKLYGLNVVAGASAGYVLIFDSATVPTDGTVTPKKVFALAANAALNYSWDRGLAFTSGIVVVFSATGPYTKTVSNTAFIETEVI